MYKEWEPILKLTMKLHLVHIYTHRPDSKVLISRCWFVGVSPPVLFFLKGQHYIKKMTIIG